MLEKNEYLFAIVKLKQIYKDLFLILIFNYWL